MNLIRGKILKCSYSSSVNTIRKEKWDLMSAVCLERKPVTSREMNDMERKFSRMLESIELENSCKSDHEVRLEHDRLQAEMLKNKSIDVDIDQTVLQTAQDFEDASLDEYNKFTFASRITDADRRNNVQSIDRKLDRHLLLVVQEKIWDQNLWLMPQGLRMDGETMLQTAVRVLHEKCGSNLLVNFYGNAPCGVFKYKYPRKFIKATVGAKVFFFKAHYIGGRVECDELNIEHIKWLEREELAMSLFPEYYKSVTQFLIDED